jgi:hypothetical protein
MKVLVKLLFVAMVSATDMADCDCSDDLGNCVDTDVWVQLCNLRAVNFSVLGTLIFLVVVMACYDYSHYSHS